MKGFWVSAISIALICAPAVAQASQLRVCLVSHRGPVGDRPGQATYRATATWSPVPGRAGHLVVGALDTSRVVWVQRTFGAIRASDESDTVDFVASDESAYPLEIAVYRLNDAAFEDYSNACRTGACYFSQGQPGVEILTPEFQRVRPDTPDVRPDCQGQQR